MAGIVWATLDLSGPYRKVFDTMLPDASQVAEPFHLVKFANQRLANVAVARRTRRSVIAAGRNDPLRRCRRLITKASDRLDQRGSKKLAGLLDAGDPRGELRMAWHAKEVVRSIYDHTDSVLAAELLTQLGVDLQDESCPIEVQSLDRTITRWRNENLAWYRGHATNGPTEAINNLIKRIKRVSVNWPSEARRYLIREGWIGVGETVLAAGPGGMRCLGRWGAALVAAAIAA